MVISIINAIRCKGSGLRHLFRIIAIFFGLNAVIAGIVTIVVPMPLMRLPPMPNGKGGRRIAADEIAPNA